MTSLARTVRLPRAARVVALLVAALLGYFVLIGYRGVYLLGQDDWRLRVLGAAVLVLPLVGAWALVVELRFGWASQRLAERLDAEGVPPDVPLPRTPGGRFDRDAADAVFQQARAEVERAPEDWRAWYFLARAYDAAADRRRARSAMRTAIGRSEQ